MEQEEKEFKEPVEKIDGSSPRLFLNTENEELPCPEVITSNLPSPSTSTKTVPPVPVREKLLNELVVTLPDTI